MQELPEAIHIAHQLAETYSNKRIERVIANQSPHKFAWYTGDPAAYNDRLAGKTVQGATACASVVEIQADEMRLVLSTSLRHYPADEKLPPKHQLLVEFDDHSSLVATVQMWGGMLCFKEGEPFDFEGYQRSKTFPSPLTDGFDRTFFNSLFDEKTPKLPAKAFLATEQRIPGLGNGVLQDILWTARIHPRRKMGTLSDDEIQALYNAVKSVLKQMAGQGGRDTEYDLFGKLGGYHTIMSKNTVGLPCPECGTIVKKEAYLGGSIYYCSDCQKV